MSIIIAMVYIDKNHCYDLKGRVIIISRIIAMVSLTRIITMI